METSTKHEHSAATDEQPEPAPVLGHSNPDRDVEETETSEDNYLAGFQLAAVLFSLCIANFLVALDTTILSTAIPSISDSFRSLQDVGWYISAYLLTNCSFQLFYGKMYTLFNVKIIFLGAMIIFEIGSLICAVAPNSAVFIFGRAVAGLGSAGTFAGALIVIIHTVSATKRAGYSGMIVGMYGIASIAGPLVGGAFTTRVTWRWCFYINLPAGGLAIIAITFFLRSLPPKQSADDDTPRNTTLWSRVARFDPVGSVFLLASIICLLLALQLGGTTYPFNNGRIIALFVVFGILLIAFVAVQVRSGRNAAVSPSIFKPRSMKFGTFYMFCVGSHFFIFVYFLPIWFQGVRGVSALQSGIDTLPILLAQTLCVVSGGIIVSVTGHYVPLMWASVVLTSIGGGLLTTLNENSSTAKWIGYQIIYGIGGGLGYQQGITAAQTVLGPDNVTMGTALMVFLQNLGGTIFSSVANNVFVTDLVKRLGETVPDLDPSTVISAGSTGFRKVVTKEQLPLVLTAYNSAVVTAFRIALSLACICAIGVAGMEWRRASTTEKKPKAAQDVQSTESKESQSEKV